MAQLPPSAVFGAVRPGQAVHVLLLIENSLPMMDHWQDLQHHILPGVLGAVRIANPGVNIQIFWETTGKTQDQRTSHKPQRHFNDFPDIDIVGLPRNKLSPLFIRQSIDLFLLGNIPKLSVTRHLFIVAMSNPLDELSGKADNQHQSQADNEKWDVVAEKLQENDIFLHVIANPVARLTRVFELFRKTMRYQSRQEVIPWQPMDTSHCICHLSGSNHAKNAKDSIPTEWPEVHLVSPESPASGVNSPLDMSDDELPSPISPIDIINSNPGSLSLVSRMQALHGLASRRRPSERSRRPSVSRSSFFRDTSPAPSPRRERLVSSRGRNKGKEKMRQLSMAAGPSRSAANSSSALDLHGLTQEPGLRSPINAPRANGAGSVMIAGPCTSSPGMSNYHPPSPGSDSSVSTLSSSLPSLPSQPHRNIEGDAGQSSLSSRHTQPALYPLKTRGASLTPSGQSLAGPSSPTASVHTDPSFTLSPIMFHAPVDGPIPYGPYATPHISSFSPYSSYPPYSTGISTASAFAENEDTMTPPGKPLQALDTEIDVVPASAPPDARGQVPFVFDAAYEAQSAMRLRRAIDSMHETGETQVPGLTNELGSGSSAIVMNWQGQDMMQENAGYSEIPGTYFPFYRPQNEEKHTGSYFMSTAKHYV